MAYSSETDKIDKKAVDGLLGVSNSLGYIVKELDRHYHNRDVWFGEAVTPSGETHIADKITTGGIDPFQLTAGNDDYGSWVQILGSSDTPSYTGGIYFDSDRFLVTGTSSTNPYFIEIASGESSGLAAKVAAGQISTAAHISSSNLNDSGVGMFRTIRTAVGEKIWARCVCIGGNATTIDFYIAVHEYEG